MILIGLAVWLGILAIYFAVWRALVIALWRAQKHRQLNGSECDGSLTVFALRVIVVAMVLFPLLGWLIYVPAYDVTTGERVLIKPRLLDDASLSCGVAGAVALCASLVFWLILQRRVPERG